MVSTLVSGLSLPAFVLNDKSRAGAHWRTHAKHNDIEQQGWDLETYAAWMKLVKGEEAREAQGGVLKDEERSGIAVCLSSIYKHRLS